MTITSSLGLQHCHDTRTRLAAPHAGWLNRAILVLTMVSMSGTAWAQGDPKAAAPIAERSAKTATEGAFGNAGGRDIFMKKVIV